MEEKIYRKFGFLRYSDSILYTELFSESKMTALLTAAGYQRIPSKGEVSRIFVKRIKRKRGKLTETISLYAKYNTILCTSWAILVLDMLSMDDCEKTWQHANHLVQAKIEGDSAAREQRRWMDFRWYVACRSADKAEGNFMLVDISEAYRIMKSLNKEPEDFIFAKEVNGKRVEYPQIFMLSAEYATEGEVVIHG